MTRLMSVSSAYMPSILGISYDVSASYYYRLISPLRTLNTAYGITASWTLASDDRALMADHFNLVVLSRVSTRRVDHAADLIARFHRNGTRVALDYDDNFFAVPETNPFQVSPEAQESIRTLLGLADGVIVPNAVLERVYREYAPRSVIVPNYVEAPAWPQTRKPNPRLRIGLLGSASHHEDWKLVMPALRKLAQTHADQFELVISAPVPEYVDIPHTAQRWVPLTSYPMLVNQIDIGLCPLEDNVFNRGKSSIKALEYGLAGAAVIASPTVYREIVAGRGTIARSDDEWYAALVRYLTHPHQRTLAGRLLSQYVQDRWSAGTRARSIMQAYQRIYQEASNAQGLTVQATTI
jgi:hypothetical protein